MFIAKKTLVSFTIVLLLLSLALILLILVANREYGLDSPRMHKRLALLQAIPVASPAIVPAGRNIAFESGNAVANAPASYLNMLDCCESDEAIAERITMGNLKARIIYRDSGQPRVTP